jgi:ribosomal protein L23
MLFRKKDNSSGVKAKTSLFARRAVKEVAEVKEEEIQELPISKDGAKENEKKSFKQTVAHGRVNPNVLRNPRVTEKGTMLSSHNVYVFDVATNANKKLVSAAVKDVYNVTPVSVRMITIPKKTKLSRRGMKTQLGGGKKAYVKLKKGDTIEIV